MRLSVILLALPFVGVTQTARGAVIFVDNLAGDDIADGSSSEPRGGITGPVRTIGRGLRLARGTDLLYIANHGVPYYEQITLAGGRFHGTPGFPFTIIGNGAILDGSDLVPVTAWEQVRGDVWKIKPFRKGHYQLVLDERPVPGVDVPPTTLRLPDIPTGEWASWKGEMYHQVPANTSPVEMDYRFANREAGITLYAVQNVRISNLTLRHYRLDGLNAHDRCRNVELINVTATGNGRSGMSIGGSSRVFIRDCDLRGNRKASLRTEELGTANVLNSLLGETESTAEPGGEKMEATP